MIKFVAIKKGNGTKEIVSDRDLDNYPLGEWEITRLKHHESVPSVIRAYNSKGKLVYDYIYGHHISEIIITNGKMVLKASLSREEQLKIDREKEGYDLLMRAPVKDKRFSIMKDED
jgi:hypothetical protein